MAKLNEQIAVLMSQIDELRKQQATLGAIQAQVAEQQRTLTQIQQNTIPAPVPAPIPEIDKSDLVVEMSGPLNYGKPEVNTPYGEYHFKISVLDKAGKHREQAPIHIDIPSDDLNTIFHRTSFSVNVLPNAITNNQLNDWYSGFIYIPTMTGIKTITFTSGDLSKSVIIEVK